MARLLALCSLPRTNPGNRLQYVRRNGPYTLTITATGPYKLPFGNLPRLLLAWVCTEAVRTRSRELVLGRSLSQFMRKLFIYHDSAGTTGARTRLRNQMNRLFGCTVSLVYEDDRVSATINSPIASRTELWWDPRSPDELVLWNSTIRLGEDFFQEIIQHPVPLNMNILRALSRSFVGPGPLLVVAVPDLYPEAPAKAVLGAASTASSGWIRTGQGTSAPLTTSARIAYEN